MPSTPTPLKADQVHQQIQQWIREGHFQPGDRLPTERELSREFGINPRTLRRGLEPLIQSGHLELRPRVGYFVCNRGAAASLTQMALILPSYVRDVRYMPAVLSDTFAHWQIDGHPMLGTMVAAFSRVLDPRTCVMHTLFYDTERFESDVIQACQARQIRGAVMRPMPELARAQVQQLREIGVQLVFPTAVPAHFSGLDLHSVYLDEGALLAEALTGLRQRGHRRLALVLNQNTLGRHLTDPVLAALPRELDLATEPHVLRIDNHPTHLDCEAQLQAIFAEAPHPTAVITADEVMAAAVIHFARSRGLRVPDDLSVVTLHNSSPGSFAPPLASPDSLLRLTQVCERAAERLGQLLRGETPADRNTPLAAPIQWHASTRSLPATLISP